MRRNKTVRFVAATMRPRHGEAKTLRGSSRVKRLEGKVLTGTGSIEGQHRWRRRDPPLAGHLAGSQTDNSAAFFVHKAQSSTVPVRLGPVVLAGPARARRQLGGDHKLGALRVEPPTVTGVSCE